MPKIRRLRDGGIGFGNKAKIGRGGLYTLIFFGVLALILWASTLVDWADARSEDEPVCYSSLCKKMRAERLAAEKEQKPDVDVTTPQHKPLYNSISIGLFKSKSCAMVVAVGGDCITNRELVKLFDNTNQAISGEFVFDPSTNDVRRTSAQMPFHWNFYKHANMHFLIAVEPDIEWVKRDLDVQIVIEPSNFVYYDHGMEVDLTQFNYTDDGSDELVLHHNVFVRGCSFARVASDPQLLTDVMNYFQRGCSDPVGDEWSPESQIERVTVTVLPTNPDDHDWYSYNKWLNQKLVECKTKC